MGRRSYSYSVHSSSHTYKQESSIGYIFLPQVSGNAPEIHHENKLESCLKKLVHADELGL